MLWPSQSLDLNPTECLYRILEQCFRQRSTSPSSKHQLGIYLLKEEFSILPVQFQRLIESIPWHFEVGVVARGLTPY